MASLSLPSRTLPFMLLASMWCHAAPARAANPPSLEETAGWILDAPPLTLSAKPTASSPWKPGQPVSPTLLAQLLKRLPEADRLPAKALWHERHGQLGKMVEQLAVKNPSPWLALAHIEAVLAAKGKPDDKQTAALTAELDALGDKAQGVELAACFAAKGALLREAEKYPEMAQNAAFARQSLVAAAAADTSETLKKSWQYRVVELRLAQLRPPAPTPVELSPLEQAANWVLASPPLVANTKLDAAPWKPGQAITPATLAQFKKRLPEADRLPLTALWWEHQGRLEQAASLLKPDAKGKESPHATWVEVARVEAILAKKKSDKKEVGAAVESLKTLAEQTKEFDQAACLAAQAHAQVADEQYADAKQSLQSAKQLLTSLATKKSDWRYRVVDARVKRLETTVAEALTPAADKLFAQGQDARKRKAWIEAAKKFHALFTQCGDSPLASQAAYLASTSLMEAMLPVKAAEELEKWFDAKRAQPLEKTVLWAQSWLLLGDIHGEHLGELEDARDAYARMIEEANQAEKIGPELKPLLADAYFSLGTVQWALAPLDKQQQQPSEDASKSFFASERLRPVSPLAEKLKVGKIPNPAARIAGMAQKGELPIPKPKLALTGDEQAKILLVLASLHLEGEQTDHARKLFLRVAGMKKASEGQKGYAAYELADSWRMEGENEKAEKILDQLIERRGPWTAAGLSLRAGLALQQGKHLAAWVDYDRLIKDFPREEETANALYVYGFSLKNHGELKKAEGLWKSLLSRFPNSWQSKVVRDNLMPELLAELTKSTSESRK